MRSSVLALWLSGYTLAVILFIFIFINFTVTLKPALLIFLLFIILVFFRVMWRGLHRQKNQVYMILRSIINNDSEVNLSESGDVQVLLEQVHDKINKGHVVAEVQANYLKALISQLDVGVIEFDCKGFIVNSNPAAERILSLGFIHDWREFLFNKKHKYISVYRENINSLQDVLFNEKSNNRGELEWNSFNVKETFLYSKIYGFIGGESRTLVTLQSIEKQLVAQEIKSYRQVVKVLTHEISNSITPMVSLTQSAQSVVGQIAPQSLVQSEQLKDLQEALNAVSRRGEHLTGFIKSFQALSQPVNAQLKIVKLSEPVIEIVRLVAEEAKDIKISVDVSTELEVMIDPALFGQVLLNLLRNSFEATKGVTSPHIHIAANRVGDRTHLDVIDNGFGIQKETAEKIFVPFFTTKIGGSGIGLPLARSLMLSQGGDLLLGDQKESMTNELGAFFKIVL